MIENLAESLSPFTEKLDEINENTKKLGELFRDFDVEDENTQTPARENKTGTQSLLDTLTLMKRSKNFCKLVEKSNGDVFWNGVFIQPLGENGINVKNEEIDLTPNIHLYFINTKLTTKF